MRMIMPRPVVVPVRVSVPVAVSAFVHSLVFYVRPRDTYPLPIARCWMVDNTHP